MYLMPANCTLINPQNDILYVMYIFAVLKNLAKHPLLELE